MLTLVDKRQDDDGGGGGEDERSCLAIMEREDRGAGGNHRNSLKVCVAYEGLLWVALKLCSTGGVLVP